MNWTQQSTFQQDQQNPTADGKVTIGEYLPKQKPAADNRLNLPHAVSSTMFFTLEEQKPTADGRFPIYCVLGIFELKCPSRAPAEPQRYFIQESDLLFQKPAQVICSNNKRIISLKL